MSFLKIDFYRKKYDRSLAPGNFTQNPRLPARQPVFAAAALMSHPPAMFPGLATDVAIQVCEILGCDPSTSLLIPQSPTTGANALERLGALDDSFAPVPELFTLPREGVDILAEKWGVPVEESLVRRHARVLLSPRAPHCCVGFGDDLGLPKRGVWPAVDGRKGGGTVFYCADCREWVIGVTRQHHRGGAGHDKQVRVAAARGREEELKGNYRKRQRADMHRVGCGQAPKGPLPPEEWDHLTPAVTPGQAAVMAAAGGVETTAGGVGTAAGGVGTAAEETETVAGVVGTAVEVAEEADDEEDAAETGGQYSPTSPSYVAAEKV